MAGQRPRKRLKRTRDTHDPLTTIPEALREELSDQLNAPRAKAPLEATRKEKRKQNRKDKKRVAHNTKTAWQKRRNQTATGKDNVEIPQPIVQIPSKQENEKPKRPKKKRKKSNPAKEPPVSKPNQEASENDPDKREIRRLEKLLGVDRKRKRKQAKGSSFSYAGMFGDDDEDMTDLLKFCDRTVSAQPRTAPNDEGESERDSEEQSDREEELDPLSVAAADNDESDSIETLHAIKPADIENQASNGAYDGDMADVSSHSEDSTGDHEILGDMNVDFGESAAKLSDTESESNQGQMNNPSQSNSDRSDQEVEASPLRKPQEKPPSKYVPPSAKMAASADIRIKRKLKGLLNRVADANASGIAESILGVLRGGDGDTFSRREMASIYAKAALDSVRDGSSVGHVNPYVSSHAAIASHLGSRIDSVILAQLLESAVRRITETLSKSAAEEAAHERVSALDTSRIDAFGYVALLCSLYERRAVSCHLIYDLVKYIAEPLVMERLELLLSILRQAGTLLRVDDPVALKDMIEFIHTQAAEQKDGKNGQGSAPSMKLQIMLDLISDIKNNKIKKSNLKENSAKFAWAGAPEQPLNASIKDLLDDEFVSIRWWDQRIGLSIEERRAAADRKDRQGDDNRNTPVHKNGGTDLSSLASSLRLNTEFRKALFTVIMSSVNVSDALERLERMGGFATGKGHDRDTALVILHCCGSEKSFNPFYALLAGRMCLKSRRLRFTFEFALWDIFKQVPGGGKAKPMSARKVSNYGQFLGYLWASEAMSLSVLRFADNLEECEGYEKSFYSNAVEHLFLKLAHNEKEGASPQGPFEKIVKETWDGVDEFRTSLSMFLRRSVRPNLPSNLKKLAKTSIQILEA